MRFRRPSRTVLTALGASAALLGATAAPSSADPQPEPQAQPVYYVALGDSLATGYQPGAGDGTTGYPDQLLPLLAQRTPGLELVKLGCRGETSVTFLQGGKCTYEEGSQLKQAVRFLKEHPGQVRYVTLDIGGNDINQCVKGNSIGYRCAVENMGTATRNLWKIITEVRKAGGNTVSYTGMNYYNPILAFWLSGSSGQKIAKISAGLVRSANGLESTLYLLAGYRVADVAGTFSSTDFKNTTTLPGAGSVPVNVARICQWTYMCDRRDIHPNAEGHRRIALTFAATIPVPSTPPAAPPDAQEAPVPAG